MTTTYEREEIKRTVYSHSPRRPAADTEIEYVLGLDPLAELIESDEWSLYWTSLDGWGYSTQKPVDM